MRGGGDPELSPSANVVVTPSPCSKDKSRASHISQNESTRMFGPKFEINLWSKSMLSGGSPSSPVPPVHDLLVHCTSAIPSLFMVTVPCFSGWLSSLATQGLSIHCPLLTTFLPRDSGILGCFFPQRRPLMSKAAVSSFCSLCFSLT